MRVGQIYGNSYLNSGAELPINNQLNNINLTTRQNVQNTNLTSQYNSSVVTEEVRGGLTSNLNYNNIQASQYATSSSNPSYLTNNNNYCDNRANGYNHNDLTNSNVQQHRIQTSAANGVELGQSQMEQKGGFVTSLTKPIQSRVDPSQIPRPVFGNITEKECNIYDSDKYTFPPNSLNEPHSLILDRGNATSKYYKLTLNQIPSQHSLLQSMKLPCAAIIQPFPLLGELDKPVPTVNSSMTIEPIRCVRCRAYANPFTCVSQNGNQCLCNFCGHTFDIPIDYLRLLQSQIKTQNYQNDDQLNYPEIYHGVVDYYAPASLGITAEPELPCYCFIIEISSYSYQNNIMNIVIYCLKHIFNQLSEKSPETNVILIFYSREIILFPYKYDNDSSSSQIKMSVISDIMEPFIPCPLSEICMPVSEAINYLNELLDKAPNLLKSHITPNNAYYSALSLAIQIFQLKKCTGSIFTFISSVPNIGIASINNKEIIIAPKSPPRRASKGMKQSAGFVSGYVVHNIQQLDLLIQQCKNTNVSVETFIITQVNNNNNINNEYTNNNNMLPTSTLSYIPQHTGGKIRLFSDFSFERIYNDVYQTLYSIFFIHNIAYDCTFKLRCSKGIAVSKIYAPWTAGGPTPDLTAFQIPKIDSNTSIAFLLRHEENLEQRKNVYLQAACLYTCKDKRVRLLRVLTISIPISTSITTAFRYASIEPIINIYARMAAHHIVSKGQRLGGKGGYNNSNNNINSGTGGNSSNGSVIGNGIPTGSGITGSVGGIGASIGNTINNSLNINNLVPVFPFSSSKNSNNFLAMWKQETLNSVIDMLFSYRENCANTSSTGQLILPDSLKLTLIYISSLFKCPALMPLNTVLEFTITEQIVGLYELLYASVSYTTALLYPRLYSIHHSLITNENSELQRLDSVGVPYQITMQFNENNNIDNTISQSYTQEQLPVISRFWLNNSIACSGERILSDGIYILENGREIYIYVGSQVDSNILCELFGVDNINSDNYNRISLINENIEMEISKINIGSRISNVIQQIRTDRFSISTYMPINIVSNFSQRLESKLKALLVEDPYGYETSYVDFLCNVHKLVQSKLVDS
ncbi:component of COPII coatamer [Cryptosporidium ryanae]|uniref:component of COPII coatamer n=1 Tax=Cryptosporidium ryanae TaxID=515981 RepID=UPI003519E3F8|nr:component of COPII coatamer [Cryptosporidium ryanae]